MDAPRTLAQRLADTRQRLETDVDAWVATGGPAGPWLVPLTLSWDRQRLLFATDLDSPTLRNVRAEPRVRVALGPTRDVVLIDGRGEAEPIAALDEAVIRRYVTRTGSDPRTWATGALWVVPTRVQAWREENELPARTLMRDGAWLG